jgi:hypothetical protein
MFRETIVVYILLSHAFAANDWNANKKYHQLWSDSALIDYRGIDFKIDLFCVKSMREFKVY